MNGSEAIVRHVLVICDRVAGGQLRAIRDSTLHVMHVLHMARDQQQYVQIPVARLTHFLRFEILSC